jgi:hypothetical protein
VAVILDQGVTQMEDVLPAQTDPNPCTARKLRSAGLDVQRSLKCYVKAANVGWESGFACLSKATANLVSAFKTAERKGACTSYGDSTTLGAIAGDIVVALACPDVTTAADVDPWTERVPSAGFGGIVTSTSAHTDVFLESPAGANPSDYIRIGTRLDWGGAIVFFGLSADPASNVIDSHDTGRDVQIALYDPTRAMEGCAWNASCETSLGPCVNLNPPLGISGLGWDPVQGGDRCLYGSTATWSREGDTLRLVANPVQWNPDWDSQDCTQTCPTAPVPAGVEYEFDLRFVSSNVVELATQVRSSDGLDHPPTAQEWPTLYVSNGETGPDLPLLLDAMGAPMSFPQEDPTDPGFFNGYFTSAEPFASFQDALQDYGVGLATDQGIRQFDGFVGEPPALYFHNVRAVIQFGLGTGQTVRGVSYLALGSFETVKAELEHVLAKRPPFGMLEYPPSNATTSYQPDTPVHLTGWALDGTAIANARVEIDDAEAASLPVSAQRSDVCATYPGYAGCPTPGFTGDVPTTTLSACPHLLRVTATDPDGNTTVLGERVIQPRLPSQCDLNCMPSNCVCPSGQVCSPEFGCIPNTPAPSLVFLTFEDFSGGAIGGLAGADAKCQQEASYEGVPGTYKAWLSDSTTSAAARLTHSRGPYVLVDGSKVADNWSDLTDGSIARAITQTLTGDRGLGGVWTGTSPSGGISYPASTCSDWTSDIGLGADGYHGAANGDWTLNSVQPLDNCSVQSPLYCFQQ